MNPEHVDNLNSISKLIEQGFTGPDATLSISIFKYGMAWREIEGGQILFVHCHSSMAGRFDRTTFEKDLDVTKEFDWVRWPDFLRFVGIDAEWFALPLTQKIFDLASYYGVEEIFGV